jgi:CheY-like chemotaxis protein
VVRCEISDLSSHGALLRPSLPPGIEVRPGMPVSVDLHLAGTRSWLGQRGRVRRCDGPSAPLAIVFDAVTPEFEDLVEDEILDELDAAHTPRVLVVDRSLPRRRRLAAALRSAGALPLEASTPLEAIDMIEACHDHLAAAAISSTLTQTGGPELAQFLADSHAGIRIGVITQGPVPRPRPGDGIMVLDAGADGDCSDAVRQLLGR